MRGQEQDKAVPREGKSKAENENQEASGLSGASGAHQIRSRITVVCAECKRLKLKCDRRNPCGSCTKRDTVARCIYSTAAAEKVDLHSLNNRLMQVESILAMVTAGESPPPFQSSYPLAQVALNTPSSTRASQARFKAPLMSPLSISLEDLRSIWLMHGQNDLDGEDGSTSVKLESIGMDNLLRLQDSDLDSTSDSPHTGPTTRARIKLPSLHAYYSQPTRATPHFRAQSAPVASETLFALLPSPPNRAKYICRAVNADPSLTLLANWDAVNQAARFPDKGGLPDLSWTASTSTTPREGVSIPAFAALTYVVAIGMLEGEGEEDTFSSDQLDDLGSQAVQVCEDYLLGENAGNEAYQANDVVDFVSAAVLRLRFKVLRLRHGSSSNTVPTNGLQALFPLIGHLVNLARTSGLTVETDDMPENISQARTLIWWEVCFYDAFISDALGQPSLILPTSFTTKLPELDLVDSQLGATSMIGDGTLKEAESSDHITSSKSRPSNNKSEFRCFCGSHGLKSGNAWRRLEDQGKGTLFVRCRITTLIQSLRQALSHYSCECNRGMGYTLDRATEVELLVRQFLDEVPPALKLHPQPRVEQSREPWMAILAAETSIMANRIIIATYVPLMRPPLDASTGEPSRARTYAAQPWSSPNRAILEASQTIITAAGALQSSKHMENPSHFLAFHPVLKAVFDATVICSHTGLGNGVGYSVSVAKVACDDATKGLDLIHTLGRLSPEMAQIVATLRQRVPADALSPVREGSITLGQQSLKRKRTRAASPALSSDLDLELSPPNDSLAIPSTPALSSTPGGTDSDHPGTSDQRVSRSSTEMAPERPKQEAHKYPPAVGIRNRGKGGPAWAKKPSSRQPTSAYPEHTLIPDPLGLSIPSRPVSSLSGTLESVASPHGSDSFMGTFSRSGLNPPLLANDPSSHAYRPSSAHPQSDLELDERYRQRRRLSYDEAATSSMPGHFDQPASFSGPVTTPDSAYFSLQGSIQGSIHRTNPDPSFGGQSLPRHLNEQPFHRTPQTPALDTRDQQFDGTLSITAVIHPPSGSTNKVTIPNNDTSIYPGYGIPDPKAFEGNSSQVDPAPSPMMPADSNAFSASAQQQPSTSQWNPSFSTPFTLDDRQPHSHYWNTDNYYQ